MRIIQTIGNQSLWEREKTLFLTSRRAPLSCYGKVFQWVEDFDKSGCAVCFNTSEFEQEVLKTLLVCHVPTTLVVLNKFRDTYNVQIEQALNEGRLLIMVLKAEASDGKGFPARLRNQYVISQVQHIACGYINPNGSIFGLLAGHSNIICLLNKEDVHRVAELEAKPCRWTVAEDKRLLRMFYEDMGIHAIHKSIGRPYSTIYNRIKSLTMNDDLLKGREFEDYVLEHFNIPKTDTLTLKEWRGDKSKPGIYPENNSAPDFVFDHDGHPFAIECKWRNHMPKDTEKELLPPERLAIFQQFATERRMPVFLILGIGGLPSDPDSLYLADISAPIASLSFANLHPNDSILNQIPQLRPTAPQKKHTRMQRQKELYSNAYRPWQEQEDKQLITLYSEGKTIDELMSFFHRNRGGITARLRKMRLLK